MPGRQLAVLLTGCLLSLVATADFYRTDGTRIIDPGGDVVFFNGINLGNWLLWEGYLMMGDFSYRTHSQFKSDLTSALGSVDRAEAFETAWRVNYVDEQAIAELASLGFNSVRVPFHYRLFWSENEESDHGFEYLDRLISLCRPYGISILLDMHAAPGYQNPGDHSDNVDSNARQPRDTVRFWDDEAHVETAARVWRHIARRYRDEPLIWGYDLMNEPVPQEGREYELLPSLVRLRDAIRSVDKHHIIVAEGSWWGSDLQKLDWGDQITRMRTGVSEAWDHNLVYQTHHYGDPDGVLGREEITNRLGIPLILGEFGENTNDNLAPVSRWSRAHTSGVFPWSFKKLFHDRALWTIHPDQRYRRLLEAITLGHVLSDQHYEGLMRFVSEDIRNGSRRAQFHEQFFRSVTADMATVESAGGHR